MRIDFETQSFKGTRAGRCHERGCGQTPALCAGWMRAAWLMLRAARCARCALVTSSCATETDSVTINTIRASTYVTRDGVTG